MCIRDRRAYGVSALPHFHRGDWGPAAGGFCGRSYLQGLTPHGFWHHAMAGREGIIDTACKTATTGYIERKLVKALEDVHIAYDGTTRNLGTGDLVQFTYGEGDAADAARLMVSDLLCYDLFFSGGCGGAWARSGLHYHIHRSLQRCWHH